MDFSDFSINLAAQKNKLAVQNYEFSCPNLRQPKKTDKKEIQANWSSSCVSSAQPIAFFFFKS
jgi:hypothetical protein